MGLDALQTHLTPQRVAACQAAYRSLVEIHRQHDASDAKELANQALIVLATASAAGSALLSIALGKEGANAFTERALTPRGLDLARLPLAVQERLWQIDSELEAAAQQQPASAA